MTKLLLLAVLLVSCGSGPSSTPVLPITTPATIPIRVTEYRVFIDLTINGVTVECLLDTGAPTIFVSQQVAERAGAVQLYETDGNILNSYQQASLGPWTWDEVEFWGRDDVFYDCLVGLRPFLGHTMTIDLVNQQLRIE